MVAVADSRSRPVFTSAGVPLLLPIGYDRSSVRSIPHKEPLRGAELCKKGNMDPRYPLHPGIRLIRMPRWAAVLMLIAAVSLGLLLIVLAAGLALILIPAAIITGMVLRWRLRRRMARAPRAGEIIDVEYCIVERER